MIWKTTIWYFKLLFNNRKFDTCKTNKSSEKIFFLVVLALFQFNFLTAQEYIPILDPPGRFEIDGNLTALDVPDGIDWAPFFNGNTYDESAGNFIFDAAGNAVDNNTSVFVRDPFDSNADDVFKGGNKYTDDPTLWKADQTKASPGKGDMSTAFYHITRNSNGDQWLFVGSDRISNNGTSYIDFEFFQGGVFYNSSTESFTTTNSNGEGRQEGDFLISVKYENGGSTATVQFFIWENNAFVDYTSIIGTNDAFAAGNVTEVRRPFTNNNAAVYDSYLFVEAGLNMTKIFGGIAGQFCDDIELESLLVKTKTSASDNATLIDFIGPVPVDIFFGAARITYEPNPVCEDFAVTYSPTIEGVQDGTFSASPGGLSIDPNSGEIDISASNAGTYTITYTFDSYGCIGLTSTYEVTISPVPDTPVTNTDYNNGDFNQCFSGQFLNANDAIVPEDDVTLVWYTSATGSETTTSPTLSSPGIVTYYAKATSDVGNCENDSRTEVTLQLRDKPVANDDSDSTAEDTPVTIDVLANDTDPENDPLTITSVTQPDNGSTQIIANEIKYTPDPNYFGTDTFTYTITDSDCGTDTAIVTVTVNPVNDNPVAVDDAISTNEDVAVLIDVLANDSDVDEDPLSITNISDPDDGTATLTNGKITYTPDADFNGVDTFTYTISDGNGGTDSATVTVTVNPVNDNPVAKNDSATTDEDMDVTIDVLANDSDVDLDPLSITNISNPDNGTATLTDGKITYTPDQDFNGIDTFTYTISDGKGGTDSATVTVTVNPVNDNPVAVDDAISTTEDIAVLIDVLANDSDVDEDPLSITNISDPDDGTATLTNGKITYTPDADFNGVDTFTYTISDGNGGTDSATVTVTVNAVNDDPVAKNDSATTDEDMDILIDVLANDSDVDLDPLSITNISNPDNGTATLTDGKITYTPDPDFNGIDTFTYTISDGKGGTDSATVTVTVNPINDPPVALDDIASTNEDTAVVIDVLANDSDVDEDPLLIINISEPSDGTATLTNGKITYSPDADFNGEDTFTYTISDGNGGTDSAIVKVFIGIVNDFPFAKDDSAITSEDTAIDINVLSNDTDPDDDILTVINISNPGNGTAEINDDNTVKYTPDPDFNGVDTFTYTISDGNGGTDSALVTVTVNSVNDNPVAVDDAISTNEDVAVLIDVLANDSDVDEDSLSITNISDPDDGTATLTNGKITYTPDADFNGVDTFTYTISDGNGGTDSATVTVTVNPVNDNPVAKNDSAITDEDMDILIDVLANDSDVDLDPLSITNISNPDNGTATLTDGKITYTPDPDFNGIDTFTYTISDGKGGTDSATVTVTVNPVNDNPVAVDDAISTTEDIAVLIDVLANDSDVDEDPLSITNISDPDDGTAILTNGKITYTPDADFNGVDTFTYTISDGNGGTDSATVTVTVNPVNDDPVAKNDSATTDEDMDILIDVLANDSDVDLDPLSITNISNPDNGTATLTDGKITYTPDPDFNGIDTFTYTISDGKGGTDSATVTVTVNPINDLPVALDDIASTNEDTAVVIDVLANDSDVDEDPLSITSVSDPLNGSTQIVDGKINYTPDADFNGVDTFTYTISDGNGGTDSATVTVTVNPVNDNPVAKNDSATTDEDMDILIDVLANDSDVDLDPLSITNISNPDNGTATLTDGKITYTPDPDFNGIDTFTYTISDGKGGTDSATVTVTVNPVNDDPVAKNDSATTDEDMDILIDVLANDSDVDEDPLSITSVSDPLNGSTQIVDGKILYTPDADFNGEDSFTYTISDGNGGTDSATVTVTVNPINDAPIARDDIAVTEENTPVIISVLANDEDIDGDDLEVSNVSDAPNGTTEINPDGTITYTPDPDFTGEDSFTYEVSDGNGGTDTATVQVFVSDESGPEIDCPVVEPLNNDDGICGAVYEFEMPEFSDNSGNATMEQIGGPSSGELFPVGDTVLIFKATDEAGNFTICSYTVTVLDAEAPVIIACAADISVSSDNGLCTASSVNLGTPSAEDNCDTDLEISNDAPNVFPVGETVVTWTVTDNDGNFTTCSQTVTVTDDQDPDVEEMQDIVVSNDPGECGAIVTYDVVTATDNCEISTITVTEGPSSGSEFEVGTTTVTYTVTDIHGNSTTESFTVTVNDTEAPALTCPENITVSTTTGESFAIVTFAEATVTDNCGATVEQTAGPVSGAQFSLGTTTVTFTATDAAGNTTECSFTVTVEDDSDPNLECPADISQNVDAGECGAVITFATPEAFDNSGNVTVEQTAGPASGEQFPVGTTTVTFTATDDAGNTAECSFEVTVGDDEAPAIEDMEDINVNNDPGVCGAIVDFESPEASDNCGIESIEQTDGLSPGTEFPVGTTTVEYTATDTAGNTVTTSFTVTVSDNESPTVECPGDITVTAEFGTEFLVVTYDEITVTDNCEGTTVEITEGFASGQEFPVGETTTVMYSITDASGNNIECIFTVTVNEDNPEPPSPPVASVTTEASCTDPFGTITVETQEGLTYSIDGENYQESGVFTDLEPGTYEVTAKDEFDQVSTATIITIDPPVAEQIVTVTGQDVCNDGGVFDLSNLLTGVYDETGVWVDTDNSGGLDNGFIDPSIITPGFYDFEYVTDGICASTTRVTLEVLDCIVLDCSIQDLRDSISKAVTPNGDNINDFFTIGLDSDCGFTYDLMIFNRWGAEVFTARNYQNNWDGFSKSSFTSSNQLPSGTYYYILEIRNSEFEPIQGYIYLGTK